MQISDRTKVQLSNAVGRDAADDLVTVASQAVTYDEMIEEVGSLAPLDSPSFTGIIHVGAATDSIGFFGTAPVLQPAGDDQGEVPPPMAMPITYVGVPDNALGDSGNMDENNRLACLANQINNLISDLDRVRTLTNRLRTDLIDLGFIRGS